jgi:RHS repeat-associated protein
MTRTTYFWDPIEDSVAQAETDGGGMVNYHTEPTLFGQVVSVTTSGDVQFLHSDGLGSIVAATNANQSIIGQWSYTAYGEFMASSGSLVGGLGFCGRWQYIQGEHDGHLSVRHRNYTPSFSHWLSVDPVRFAGFGNQYGYVDNRPTLMIDPSGEFAWIPICCTACVATLAITIGVPATICWSAAEQYRNDPLGYVVNGRRVRGSDAVWAAFFDCLKTYNEIQAGWADVIGKIMAIGSCVCCGAALFCRAFPSVCGAIVGRPPTGPPRPPQGPPRPPQGPPKPPQNPKPRPRPPKKRKPQDCDRRVCKAICQLHAIACFSSALDDLPDIPGDIRIFGRCGVCKKKCEANCGSPYRGTDMHWPWPSKGPGRVPGTWTSHCDYWNWDDGQIPPNLPSI